MNEFELIKHYFTTQTHQRTDVVTGIGDDAAILTVPANRQLVATTDTLVAGIHFGADATAYDIGYKALAVNLSDLAAMGATPAWVTLALTIPQADESWIQSFCDGFFTLANRFQVALAGGDLTHGPLSITVQALGLVPAGTALLRQGARAGDLVFVTGTLGDAGLALQCNQNNLRLNAADKHMVFEKLNRPEPRLATGNALRGIASACIDISDGLAADLGHLLSASGVGAIIETSKLPLSEALTQTLSTDEAILLALTAGDDYELCFTIPPAQLSSAQTALSRIPCRFTQIGIITDETGLTLQTPQGKMHHDSLPGYQHF